MAWIEVHQNLSLHPKLLNLAHELGEDRLMTMGRLLLLWWWALDVTRDGALQGVTCHNIASVMSWSGDADQLVNALLKWRWLDKSDDGKLSIHHWEDYGGKLTAKREIDRERQRRHRALRNAGHNADVTPVSPVSHVVDKTTEDNSTVDNISSSSSSYALYENNIGLLSPMLAEQIKDADKEYTAEWVGDAIKEAVNRNHRSWTYIAAILENWKVEGRDNGRHSHGKNQQSAPKVSTDEERQRSITEPLR